MRVLNYLSEVTFIRTSKNQRSKDVITALTLSLAPLAAHPDGTIKVYEISVYCRISVVCLEEVPFLQASCAKCRCKINIFMAEVSFRGQTSFIFYILFCVDYNISGEGFYRS